MWTAWHQQRALKEDHLSPVPVGNCWEATDTEVSGSLPPRVWRRTAKQAPCFASWLQQHMPAWWVTWALAASELSRPWNNSYRENTKQRGRVPPLANLPKKYSSEAGEETFYKINQQASVWVPLGRWATAGDGDELCWIAHGCEAMSKETDVCSKGYYQLVALCGWKQTDWQWFLELSPMWAAVFTALGSPGAI